MEKFHLKEKLYLFLAKFINGLISKQLWKAVLMMVSGHHAQEIHQSFIRSTFFLPLAFITAKISNPNTTQNESKFNMEKRSNSLTTIY